MSDHLSSCDDDLEDFVDLIEVPKNTGILQLSKGNSPKISALKLITVFLWFVGNEAASFRDVADRFSITKSSLLKIIRKATYFLSNLSREVIRWQTTNEKIQIERHFRQNNFPGAIGITDGTHIRIEKPGEDPDSYLYRKHYHSIQAQIVCDHQQRIRDIFVGYPGSVHDSRVLKTTSPLYQMLAEKCEDFIILGDNGYQCEKFADSFSR
ncbi:hypothetical protein NQ314_000044 [Rhamnusium bicolor]|uniref:DDE Tnp4 domain-containing protein n=1 Tax=Rhamnusium bicolor TaxID=1586634 RepID=A0AAV8ZXY2_9CUCU|nr:hypothetical protein NQ314_000044 [Rhamnusium bicolor]